MKRSIPLLALACAAALAVTVAPSGAGNNPEPPREFKGAYSAALGWADVSHETGQPGLMAALVTCGAGGEYGGSCAPTYLDEGETLTLSVTDAQAPEVRFMACVDGNFDGICRPEFPEDSIYVEPCDDGDDTLTVPHQGRMGLLDVYVLHSLTSTCIPIDGSLHGAIHRQSQCSDLQDNDGDGAADYPLDPDCSDPWDTTERPPQCRDQADNDNSGLRDWPNDPGCSSPDDDVEWSPECSNRKDDDGDGHVDHPNDPDCTSRDDTTERAARVN